MCEHRLRARPALGIDQPDVVAVGPVRIAESMGTALGSLASRRGRDDEVRRIAADAGIPLPAPGQMVRQGDWAGFWLAPSQWMIEGPQDTYEDIAAVLKTIFGESASVTEQTDAWVRLEVTGPLRPMFERLCNLDLVRFVPGSATRTIIEHLGCYVLRQADDRITLLGPRSSAASLHHALISAARSAF
ncbi:sarcosine oxidase subunit gamma [Rubellimicrobium arenae]|uniref:sarcosine oxidase subunit gamma n=1 Tax=Rubellimicrobium arenae TaxID=2817372 RepID=UPI001B3015CE|nr:sarcosine oxidase subunit gamma [Rubellimicrobium arenae]